MTKWHPSVSRRLIDERFCQLAFKAALVGRRVPRWCSQIGRADLRAAVDLHFTYLVAWDVTLYMNHTSGQASGLGTLPPDVYSYMEK